MAKRRIILDVDTGTDDAVAIMLACHSPELEVMGITVTWGNRPVENCVDNTLRVLEMMNVRNVPVYQGCPDPMVRYLTIKETHSVHVVIDGKEYSIHPAHLPLPETTLKKQDKHAVSYIVETLLAQKEKVTFVSVGPPTNLGMAIRMRPQITEHLEQVVFMGGAVNKGNTSPVAEANFYHDPEAAKIIIDSGVPCVFMTLNATHSAELNLDDAVLFEKLNTKEGDLTAEIIRLRIEAFVKLGYGNGYSDAMHDALAIAWLVDPNVITEFKKAKCDIDIGQGLAYGQLVVDERSSNEGTGKVNCIAMKADKDRFLKLLLERFA